MYTKVLVPLDGSKLSEGILPYARSFAKAFKTPVELLRVIEPEIISTHSDPDHGRYLDIVEADLTTNSIAYLEGLTRSFPDPSSARQIVVIGKPAEVIVDRAAAEKGALVAMSTHGRSGLQRWLLGSVANKMLHATTNPLLLIRTTDKAKTSEPALLKTVLVPLDGSNLAEKVLPHVVELARKMKLEVVLLRVYTPPSAAYLDDYAYPPNLDRITEEFKAEAQEYLKAKVEDLRREGLNAISSIVLQGNAGDEIIEYAKQTPDNLVAMCTHGRSGVGRWILGSVTDRVVRHSEDPVLVIRASA